MRHELDIWIMGGDRRQARLAGLLAEDGHTVHTLGLGPAVEGAKEEWELSGAALADCVVLPLPVAAPGGKLNAPLAERELPLEQVFAGLRPGQVICAGRVDRPRKRWPETGGWCSTTILPGRSLRWPTRCPLHWQKDTAVGCFARAVKVDFITFGVSIIAS